MRIRHQDQPDITIVLVDGDHISRGAERKRLAESADGRGRVTVCTSWRIILSTVRSRIQPISAALRMVSPRKWKRQVANE